MKVARLHSVGNISLHDEPVPVPDRGESLVRVKAVGLCGSDLHWFSEAGIGDAKLEKPLVLGHEFAGVTESGQWVAVDPAIPCGQCEYCLEGNPNLCLHLLFAGHGAEDGGLREMLTWPRVALCLCRTSLNDTDGAMLEPLGVALHAIDLGKIQAGMRAGVFGCGPIGLLVLQLAKIAGALEVRVSEPLTYRLAVALQLGGLEWKPGLGVVDVVFECAGENRAVEDALTAVKPGGRVVLVGIPDDDRISLAPRTRVAKGSRSSFRDA